MHDSGVSRDRVSHILVVQPPGRAPRMARGLARLPGHTTVEIVHDAGSCLARCETGRVDVLVLDARQAVETGRVLDATGASGPPAIVIGSSPEDAACLAWYRAGAADVLSEGLAEERLSHAVGRLLDRAAAQRLRDGSAAGESGSLADPIASPLASREALDHLNSALLIVDKEGRIVYGNPAAEQILGKGSEALHGAPVWRWFRGEPRDENPIARSLAGERLKGAETLLTRRDGGVTLVGISCAPIAAQGGDLGGAVAIFQDLSEVTQQRSHALQKEKLASIGQLAAGVAHEINNPMGFIHANLFQLAEYATDLRQVWSQVDALQQAVREGDPEQALRAERELSEAATQADVGFVLSDLAKAIRESQEGSERIRHIVQDLRDFSYQDTAEQTWSDLNQCLDSTANIVWPMMKHVVVLEKSYAELPPVSCFPMQLKQVFMNLLVNAFQAIEEAVGTSGHTGTIALETLLEGEEVVVSIRDTGVGIPPEHLDRIFDPFFTTKNVGAGTGLGLSTSFGIVQRHGGTLSVESRSGQGTVFRLRLPVDAEDAG